MKKKILSVLLTLVLVLTFSLMTAVPAMAGGDVVFSNYPGVGDYDVWTTDSPSAEVIEEFTTEGTSGQWEITGIRLSAYGRGIMGGAGTALITISIYADDTGTSVVEYWDTAFESIEYPGGFSLDVSDAGVTLDADTTYWFGLRTRDGSIGWERTVVFEGPLGEYSAAGGSHVFELTGNLVEAAPEDGVDVDTTVAAFPTLELVVPSEPVVANVPFDVSSIAANTDGIAYDSVRFNITLSGPAAFTGDRADTFTIIAVSDPLGLQGFNETFELVGENWVGYWGPVDGFPMEANYGPVTVDFTIEMAETTLAGDYTIDVGLVDLVGIPEELATATGTFTLGSLVQISLEPTSLDFGSLRPGDSSPAQTVTISNTGNIDVIVTAETASAFYQEALTIDTAPIFPVGGAGTWVSPPILFGGFHDASLVVAVPEPWDAGMQSSTIIFWAEAQ